jgi:hypothetical protein
MHQGIQTLPQSYFPISFDIPVSSASCLGVKFGRLQKFNKEQQTLALRLLKEGKSINEVANTLSDALSR